MHKEKVDIERRIIFDVALSFAGEQRKYVRKVAELLRGEGIRVFYDEFFKGKMWRRDLAEYLMNIYYKQSRFCIMFISKDYISKAWPTHERRSAIARNVEQLGGYILPVRFDDSEVPGLPSTTGHINGQKTSPEEIASLFIEVLDDVEEGEETTWGESD